MHKQLGFNQQLRFHAGNHSLSKGRLYIAEMMLMGICLTNKNCQTQSFFNSNNRLKIRDSQIFFKHHRIQYMFLNRLVELKVEMRYVIFLPTLGHVSGC